MKQQKCGKFYYKFHLLEDSRKLRGTFHPQDIEETSIKGSGGRNKIRVKVRWLLLLSNFLGFGLKESVSVSDSRTYVLQLLGSFLMGLIGSFWIDDLQGMARRLLCRPHAAGYNGLSILSGRSVDYTKNEVMSELRKTIVLLGLGYSCCRQPIIPKNWNRQQQSNDTLAALDKHAIQIRVPKEKLLELKDLSRRVVNKIRGSGKSHNVLLSKPKENFFHGKSTLPCVVTEERIEHYNESITDELDAGTSSIIAHVVNNDPRKDVQGVAAAINKSFPSSILNNRSEFELGTVIWTREPQVGNMVVIGELGRKAELSEIRLGRLRKCFMEVLEKASKERIGIVRVPGNLCGERGGVPWVKVQRMIYEELKFFPKIQVRVSWIKESNFALIKETAATRFWSRGDTDLYLYEHEQATSTENKRSNLQAIENLVQNCEWRREGKNPPREVLFLAERGGAQTNYEYSGKWHTSQEHWLEDAAEITIQHWFDTLRTWWGIPQESRGTLLLNRYTAATKHPSGAKICPQIPPHSDNEPLYQSSWRDLSVFGLSFGDDAHIRLDSVNGGESVTFKLIDGSLFIMDKACQRTHKHSISERYLREGEIGKRISLTFRFIPKGAMGGVFDLVPEKKQTNRLKIEDLQQYSSVFRWTNQLSMAHRLSIGFLNSWQGKGFFRSHIQKIECRSELVHLIKELTKMADDRPVETLSPELLKEELQHAYNDASGNFEQLNAYLASTPEVDWNPFILKKIILESEVYMGGWVRFVKKGKRGSVVKAWRMKVRVIPIEILRHSPVHIGMFELLAFIIGTKFVQDQEFFNSEKVTLVVHCDNQGEVYRMSKMASDNKLVRAMLIVLVRYLKENKLNIFPSWIRGYENVMGDAASREEKSKLIVAYAKAAGETAPDLQHLSYSALEEIVLEAAEVLNKITNEVAGGIHVEG